MHRIGINGFLIYLEKIVDKFHDFAERVFSSPIGDLLEDYTALIPNTLENLTIFQMLFEVGFYSILAIIFIKFILDVWPG